MEAIHEKRLCISCRIVFTTDSVDCSYVTAPVLHRFLIAAFERQCDDAQNKKALSAIKIDKQHFPGVNPFNLTHTQNTGVLIRTSE